MANAQNAQGYDPALGLADLARQLGLQAGAIPGLPIPVAAGAPRAKGAVAPGAAASKWDLATLASAPGIPSLLLQGISGGPLTPDEAQALADRLTGISSPSSGEASSPGSTLSERLFGNRGPDPELSALQRDLDALQPAAAAGTEGAASSPKIDGAALRGWFQALDVSRDAALSFLEWRDRTGLPLGAFRNLDQSGEGLLSFDEFARALLINAAQAGQREIDPALLEWALDAGTEADGSKPIVTTAADLDALSNEEAMARARAELAAAALLLPRPTPDATAIDPAKQGQPAKPGQKGARPKGARQGLPEGIPPSLKELDDSLPRSKVGGG